MNNQQFHEKNNKLENVAQNIIPRKILSPVFIVEEDVRPLDLTTNLDSLIIKAQCSKIGKKVQFQKYKNTLFAFSKMAKKYIFASQ